MQAVIKGFYISNEEDLSTYEAGAPSVFGFDLNLAIGPVGSEGEDFFELLVASPTYLANNYASRMPAFLRHVLLMADYNVPAAVAHVSKYLDLLEGDTWSELAIQIGRMARWEFEDYRPRA